MTPLEKSENLASADTSLSLVRFAGNVAVSAFFAADNDRKRQTRRDELLAVMTDYLAGNVAMRPTKAERELCSGQKGILPFHWEIEFPEVFGRANPGFDCIVGNPPFLGGARVSTELGMPYFSWLRATFPPARHQCDLVAYFFRRAFKYLRQGGCFGLIATNTISQGDTREGGLCQILQEEGAIVEAVRRYKWPGIAAVIVSVVHVAKKAPQQPAFLDGKPVDRISAFLFPGEVDRMPAKLCSSPVFSAGSDITGQGFLFDDGDPKASPLSQMREILALYPSSQERIFPYIGGEEVNTSPTQSPHRFVIYLSDLNTEEKLEEWPALASIVREKVKPERDALGGNPNNIPLKRRWWAYHAHRPELYSAILKMDRVLVISRVTRHVAFAFLPSGLVFSHKLCVLVLSAYSAFCTLQSRIHEVWAWFFSSTMKDDLNYSPSDCFETFPLPEAFETHPQLEAAGQAYYDFRAALMVRNNEGLTKTYNRFHDPNERSPDILELRELHAAMDRAVLDAYGWTDLKPSCEFLLDYEEEEDEEEAGGRQRKKPWRCRWPDEVRDEVLARLLELNKKRAEEEAILAAADKPARQGTRRKRTRPDNQRDLLPED